MTDCPWPVATAHGAGDAGGSSAATGQGRQPRRRSLAWEWRAAAGIAAVAVGAMSYAVGRGHTPLSSHITPAETGASANERTSTPRASRSAAQPVTHTAEAPHGLMFAGGVSDLPDSAVRALLQSMDDLQALPDSDPQPVLDPVGEGAL